MFHNYFFLKRLAASLECELKDLLLLECFSQNKDELILGFSNETRELWLRVNLAPQICLIQIIPDFKRAKKNSVNLFPEIVGHKVAGVSAFQFERSFELIFNNQYELIFKMHASRSNLILTRAHKVISLFRNHLPNDLDIEPQKLHKDPDISWERFRALDGNPSSFLPALGKEVKAYFKQKDYESLGLTDKWVEMQNVLTNLEKNPIRIVNVDGKPQLSLLPQQEETLIETDDPIEASNLLYQKFTQTFYLGAEKQKVAKLLENQIRKTENYISKTSEKLESIRNSRSYEEIANIIMANLHQIPKNQKEVTLFDFYNEESIKIKLNTEITPQKNAENLYRKSKNQKIEIGKLEENIGQRKKQLLELQNKLEEIKNSEDIRNIRKELGDKTLKKEETILPYHKHEFMGYDILIGKNAKSNDTLTLKVANKEDLWLHAKDVPGSHVVIRHQAGKVTPKDVIERAAAIAAWFSKRKTDSLCPVIYTPKKFVRKRKGDPPGAVVVEKESVIMMEPKGF